MSRLSCILLRNLGSTLLAVAKHNCFYVATLLAGSTKSTIGAMLPRNTRDLGRQAKEDNWKGCVWYRYWIHASAMYRCDKWA
ncbi:uncharacterized protein HD556DRAFT_510030 [Suillus plorans]|uniref:Secreted protein n=1 Tax=Suillus plorans TaxID=116603 RepID=A0A9P7AQI1_9AGAM|nr:uncharacterized protein HD556DRAFT_510030 [Suillus plorans]KAG1793510.1 hypothetical protein HD556DRAFT_510030 [Suillus plorans]